MLETSANIIFHGLEYRNPSFEKIYVEKQKNPFGEGQVPKDPIPAFPGHESKNPAILLGDR
jgi:hypothetical protein